MKGIKLYSSDGFRIQSSDGYYINTSMEEIIQNVDYIPQIPHDAKMAVKDFIKSNFLELCEKLPDLDSIDIPIELVEKLPDFIEYIGLAFNIL